NGAEPQAKNTPSAAASTAIHAASINKLHKTPASGPDGHSRGHLAGARRRSRGHQVGHVRASNQQHQRHQNTQRSKRATVLVLQSETPVGAGSSTSLWFKKLSRPSRGTPTNPLTLSSS